MKREKREKLMKDAVERKLPRQWTFHERLFRSRKPTGPVIAPGTPRSV